MSQTYKCIAIDDDPLFLEILKSYIKKVDMIDLLATYNNPIDGAVGVTKYKPDFIFLDIEMPYMDGYETIATLETKPKIIIVSSHLEYETDELKIDVSKFVRKPINGPDHLTQVVQEVMAQA